MTIDVSKYISVVMAPITNINCELRGLYVFQLQGLQSQTLFAHFGSDHKHPQT